MNNWILLIIGIVAAFVAWKLLNKRFLPDSIPTKNSTEDEKLEECTDIDFLREAVRLS